jgi:hypothetical protein
MHKTPLVALAAAFSITAPAFPQNREVYRPATPFVFDRTSMHPQRVIVKFDDGARVRLVGAEWAAADGAALRGVREAVRGHRVERLFTRSADELDRERAELQRLVPVGEPPLADLNSYYLVTTDGAGATERLVDALLREPIVATAYAEHLVVPTDIPPPTPLFENRQTYLGAPPSGYGYSAIESIVGARGHGIRMAQLEGRHTYGHEDVSQLVATDLLGSAGSAYASWEAHSTACVGIMAANRNGFGVRGLGSDCERFYTSSLQSGAANMVSLATGVLRAGDAMSSSYAWVVAGGLHAPADWDQSVHDAVRIASTKGVHYAFSAGNTSHDLGDTGVYGNRYVPTAVGSGGFIIGASGAGDLARASFSNFGTRIEANGWGAGVATIGYGDLFNPNDIRQHYAASFGGTSAAAPAVAGVIASLSGAVKEQNGRTLTNTEIRTALRATGTPITGTIGTRPDLGELLARFGLPDGLLTTRDGTVGGSFGQVVTGPAGAPFGLVLSTGRGNSPIGANRPVLLDPVVLIAYHTGVLPPGGTASLTFGVPLIPALAGRDMFAQAVQDRGGTFHLSNSVVVRVQ